MNENDKNYIVTELERILSTRESIATYKDYIKGNVIDLDDFESFFPEILKLSNLFDGYKTSKTKSSYLRLYEHAQKCGFSKSWIDNIIKKAGLEIVSEIIETQVPKDNVTPMSEDNKKPENASNEIVSVPIPKKITQQEEKSELKKSVANVSKESPKSELIPDLPIPDEKIIKYKYCSHCGKTITTEILYCPFCGKPQKMKDCWVCRRKIPFGAQYCPYCNSKNKKR